jgi:hypothetical protein
MQVVSLTLDVSKVGYTPHKNQYNLPGIYMNYISLYKFMHDQGHPDSEAKDVPLVSPTISYHSVWNDGGQDMFVEFSIYTSLEGKSNNQVYNIAECERPYSYG